MLVRQGGPGASLLLILLAQTAAQPAANAAPSGDSAPNEDVATDDTPSNQGVETELEAGDARAKRHWHSGMAYLEEGEPTSALAAFNKAYQLSGRPSILLAIAAAHEQRGDLARAIAALRRYLTHASDATKADKVRARIDALQKKYDAELAALRRARERDSGLSTNVQAVQTPKSPSPAGATEASTGTHDSSPLLWTSLAVGTAAAAGAVALGLAANHEYNALESECGGQCSAAATAHGRSLALTSTLLTGLAALGFGVGSWLALSEPERPPEQVSWTPKVQVTASPWGGHSQVRWGF